MANKKRAMALSLLGDMMTSSLLDVSFVWKNLEGILQVELSARQVCFEADDIAIELNVGQCRAPWRLLLLFRPRNVAVDSGDANKTARERR